MSGFILPYKKQDVFRQNTSETDRMSVENERKYYILLFNHSFMNNLG